jgi:hypothetical protein
VPPANGQIAPTATTCSDFTAGTAGDLTMILYGIKNGKINNVAPGVLFYYSAVVAPSSSFTIDVVETNSNSAFNLFGVQKGQVNLYSASCGSAGVTSTTTLTTGNVHIAVSGATAGATYIIGIKYDPGSVTGQSVGNPPPTIHYDWFTKVNGGVVATDPDGLDLKPKP